MIYYNNRLLDVHEYAYFGLVTNTCLYPMYSNSPNQRNKFDLLYETNLYWVSLVLYSNLVYFQIYTK